VATFDQFLIPAVQLETAQGTIANLDGSGLRFDWTITRDNTPNPDQAEILIYNLAPVLAGEIAEAWITAWPELAGYRVSFGIGWQRIAKTVIDGDVWDLIPDERTPTDRVLRLKIGDGNTANRDSVFTATYKAITVVAAVELIATLKAAAPGTPNGGGLGLEFPESSRALVSEAAKEVAVKKINIAGAYNARELMDDFMDTLGLEWRVTNGQFIALRGGVINRPGPIVKPSTGLISYTTRNDKGIDFTALADPEVEPGIQVQVVDDNGQPFGAVVYRVDRVTFSGNTDGESIMAVSASKGVGV
jgi:hypothetical protein